MWWNFVARDHDEIVQMRADWESHTPRFGEVRGYDGPPLPAPPMPITRLVPARPGALTGARLPAPTQRGAHDSA